MNTNKYFLAFLIHIHLFEFLFAICQSGYYYNSLTNRCLACPDGYYCTDNSNSPIPCPLGTFSNNPTGGITQCTECKLGYYANKIAATSCKACPDGYYCCNPSLPPTPCPIGTYSSNSTGGIYECKSCPSGTSNSAQGSTNCQSCESCQNNPQPPKCLSEESLVIQSIENSSDTQCPNEDMSCLANQGDCRFYDELENIKKCGSSGYMLNYGKKYCIKFGDYYDKFNDDGKLWINSVRKCLMHKLLNNTMNCDNLKHTPSAHMLIVI